MSGVRVEWTGLDAFLRDMHALPQDLQRDGFVIVREETEGAAAEIVQQYPRVTGALQRRVKTQFPSSTILIGLVLSSAPHSHLYEFGTKKRTNAAGANRGVMPAKAVTVPIARRRRARMSRRLVDLLRANGFEVGNA